MWSSELILKEWIVKFCLNILRQKVFLTLRYLCELHQLITDMKTVILLFKFSDDDDWNIQMRPSKSYMSKTEIWTKIKTFFSERRHRIATTLPTTIPTILCCDSTPTHSREDESTSEVCVDVEPNIDLTTRTGLWNLSSCWTVEHLLLLCLLSGPKNLNNKIMCFYVYMF